MWTQRHRCHYRSSIVHRRIVLPWYLMAIDQCTTCHKFSFQSNGTVLNNRIEFWLEFYFRNIRNKEIADVTSSCCTVKDNGKTHNWTHHLKNRSQAKCGLERIVSIFYRSHIEEDITSLK